MTRTCIVCSQPFAASSYRATYCSGRCRKRAERARAAGLSASPVTQVAQPAPSDPDPGSTVADSVRATLAKASMADTPLGRTALVLAQRLDDPGKESGAGLAAVARQLTAILATVAATAPRTEDDPLAQIRARRDAKRAAPLPDPEDRPA